MRRIRICLKGDVAFRSHIKLEEGYACDVPTDEFGIPYLPLAQIMREIGLSCVSGLAQVGPARPDGYRGILREASRLVRDIAGGARWIRALYTRESVDSDTGSLMRCLTCGQVFYAPLNVAEADLDGVSEMIESITQMGVTEPGVSGAVECRVEETQDEGGGFFEPAPDSSYVSLDYSVMLLAPTALHAPCDRGTKTCDYIPGAEMRRALAAWQTDAELLGDLQQMRFSNAYVALCGVRQVPVPLSCAASRLDHEQLRYRLEAGKDVRATVREVTLAGAYGLGFDEHRLTHVRPHLVRIATGDGTLYDALEAGQVLKGTIYGTDEQVRRVAKRIAKDPYLGFGQLVGEGYGMAYCVVAAMGEARPPRETLMSRFDLLCVSHVAILDDRGNVSGRLEELVREAERQLGLEEGRLETEGTCIGICTDNSHSSGLGADGPTNRFLEAGSVVRLRTRDGGVVDVSPILHAFVGQGVCDGYGEIMTWPATDECHRDATEAEPDRCEMPTEPTIRDMHIAADMVHRMLVEFTRSQVKSLAQVDASAFARDPDERREVPIEQIRLYHDTYVPTVDIARLVRWYLEGFDESMAIFEGMRRAADEAPGV